MSVAASLACCGSCPVRDLLLTFSSDRGSGRTYCSSKPGKSTRSMNRNFSSVINTKNKQHESCDEPGTC